jgi:DNA-directed RNA polymerase specialized sigma24 family protein
MKIRDTDAAITLLDQVAHTSNLLTLTELEVACRKETHLYRQGKPSDPCFCLEIFRRALLLAAQIDTSAAPVYADESARAMLVGIYTEFIKAHINRDATRATPLDDLVQQVWLRFWRAANQGLTFPSLEAALMYLKQTTISELIENNRRAHMRRRDESLERVIAGSGEESLSDGSADPFAQHTQQRFRARCREVLTNPLEYRVFSMRYGLGLSPREIAVELVREGVLIKDRQVTARAVSDLLDRSFNRLGQDPEIHDLLCGD